MLKDMQSQFAPGKTTSNADILAGEGKKNTGLEGLGVNNASKYSVTAIKDPLAFEGKKNLGLEGIKDGSKYGLTGKGPKAYIDTVER
tara:strand:+ start:2630 stop:2890 length:261 start_codon:yes stop_codon:yes gene_type:complete